MININLFPSPESGVSFKHYIVVEMVLSQLLNCFRPLKAGLVSNKLIGISDYTIRKYSFRPLKAGLVSNKQS